MSTSTCDRSERRNLGLHHVAYLRAIAEGVDRTLCARLYLDAQDAAQARDAHQEIVEAAKTIARQSPAGRSSWRLLGMLVAPKKLADAPTLEQYIEQRNLHDWDEAECLVWYLEDHPQPPDSARRNRLLSRQMELIRVLETAAAQPPSAQDPIECWYDETTTQRLAAAGIRTLGNLLQRTVMSANWYAQVPAIGAEKASRIAAQAKRLIPDFACAPAFAVLASAPEFPKPLPANVALIVGWTSSGIAASTAKRYEREATRFALWLESERAGTAFTLVRPEDCSAYTSFLASIPEQWISKSQARLAPFSPGWAPFREQPSEEARSESIAALTTLFGWLRQTGAVDVSPWAQDAPATTAGRPRGGGNPFQAKMAALRGNLAQAERSLETALLMLICCLLETREVSAQALTKLGTVDLATDASSVRVGKKWVPLPPDTTTALEELLTWRCLKLPPTGLGHPLLCNPRFPDRPLSYRTLLTLMEKWGN